MSDVVEPHLLIESDFSSLEPVQMLLAIDDCALLLSRIDDLPQSEFLS